MIFARRESRVRMFFFSRHALKIQELIDKYTLGDQKPFDIIDRDTFFRAAGDEIIILSLLTNRMTRTANLTGD